MAPFDRRDFSGNAVPTTLTGSIDNDDLTITIVSATGWPEGDVGPFIVTIDRGLATEEKVEILSRTGSVLTVSPTGRGHDNTAAASHSAGATIEHTLAARDVAEANQHIADDTLDHHSQYLNAARHNATTHAISAGEVEPGAIGYTELAAGQRWEPGDFKWSMQTADHAGWLKMDGRNTLSRTTYAALFGVVGTTMGTGDGATTFGIADVAKRVIVGKTASGTASTLGGTGGSANTVVVTHTHVQTAHNHTGSSSATSHSHGHTLGTNTTGSHVHGVDWGDTGDRITISWGSGWGITNVNVVQSTALSRLTASGDHAHTVSGGVSAEAAHVHGVTVNNTTAVNLDAGVSGTDANLPPFLVMNGFIHV